MIVVANSLGRKFATAKVAYHPSTSESRMPFATVDTYCTDVQVLSGLYSFIAAAVVLVLLPKSF